MRELLGNTNYRVKLENGGLVHRHINQMLKRYEMAADGRDPEEATQQAEITSPSENIESSANLPEAREVAVQPNLPDEAGDDFTAEAPASASAECSGTPKRAELNSNRERTNPTMRRSARDRKPPSRFADYE